MQPFASAMPITLPPSGAQGTSRRAGLRQWMFCVMGAGERRWEKGKGGSVAGDGVGARFIPPLEAGGFLAPFYK